MRQGTAWNTGPSAVMGVIWGVSVQAFRPSSWPRTTRNVLARQIYFTGVQAVPLISGIGVLVGLTVVAQTQIWLQRLGGSSLLGTLLGVIVVTNLAPFLVNFVVIGRSGTAITTELATMEVTGETRVLDALGIEPFLYLVIPRVLRVGLSMFELSAIFTVISLASGFMLALITQPAFDSAGFVRSIAAAMGPMEFLALAGKCMMPAMATGALCCLEGLSVGTALTEIPQATTRAVVRSVVTLFVFTAVFSALVGR